MLQDAYVCLYASRGQVAERRGTAEVVKVRERLLWTIQHRNGLALKKS
jgi:hypothetical protein